MQLSVLVYLSFFLLSCGGFADATAARLRVPVGGVAATSLLLAGMSLIEFSPLPWLMLNIGTVLLLLIAVCLCRGLREITDALLLALCTGVLSFLLLRVLPEMTEPGIFAALPATLFGWLLFQNTRTALLTVVAAPVFQAASSAAETAFLFDAAALELGGESVAGAQAFGVLLLAFLWSATQWNRENRKRRKIRA